MSIRRQQELTDAQAQLLDALHDVSEHVHYEFDPDEYDGLGTCGFAHVHVGGNTSFVRSVMSLADDESVDIVTENHRGYRIEVPGLDLSLDSDTYRGGYRLSIVNVSDFRPGPEHQRLDVRRRLHTLLRARFELYGYLTDASVRTRVD